MNRKYSPEKRIKAFWKKVAISSPDTCWLWKAASYTNQYGTFWNGFAQVGAHVFSFIISKGPVPTGHYVCHKCDNPKCVNPDHLFVDKPKGNQQDMLRKGRANKSHSEHHPKTKLTPEQVRSIRCDTRPLRAIAQTYQIRSSTVFYIRSGKHWKYLDEKRPALVKERA